jgi:hypothetical protein
VSRIVTVVMTVNARNAVTLSAEILKLLEAQGAELVGCDWAPDPDTIVDALPEELAQVIGAQGEYEVIDLNPTVGEWRDAQPDGMASRRP